jgi:hypothetical protein
MPTPYQNRIVADGPVAYWPLGDVATSLTADDLIGARASGTIAGTVTRGVAGVPGSGATAMAFDGVTGRIDAPAIPSIQAAHTFEAWMKFPRGGNLDNAMVVTRQGILHGCFRFRARSVTVNPASLVVDYPFFVNYSTAAIVSYDAWHHAVVTFDGTTVTGYVDGAVDAQTAMPGFTDAEALAVPLSIGLGADVTNQPVTLQDVAVYTRALTPTEVAAHYALRRRRIAILPLWRNAPGIDVEIPTPDFGFFVTINDVLYVQVSLRADGTHEYIPFKATA